MKNPLFVALFAAGSVLSSVAVADVAEDALRLTDAVPAGAAVTRLAPRLLLSHEALVLALPAASTEAGPGCTAVVVLGAVSTVFSVRVGTPHGGPPEIVQSAAGAALVSRCDDAKGDLRDVSVETRSPRAILEIAVVTSPRPLPTVPTLLPNREPGIVPPAERLGPSPRPGPLEGRLRQFEDGLVRSGVSEIARKVSRADSDGAGKVLFELSPGCHRVGVFAAEEGEGADVRDIDADLSWVSGELVASERTESPDATLFACNTERDLAVLSYAGAAPRGAVVLVRGRSEIPAGVPRDWGRSAASGIARSLAERHAPPLSSPPSYTSLGVAGLTLLPVEVRPGQCYIAALGVVEGASKLVALAAETGGAVSSSHGDESENAVSVAFCAGTSRRALLTAEVHGVALVWALGLWPTSSRRLGEGMP